MPVALIYYTRYERVTKLPYHRGTYPIPAVLSDSSNPGGGGCARARCPAQHPLRFSGRALARVRLRRPDATPTMFTPLLGRSHYARAL